MTLVSFRIMDAADQQFGAVLGGRRTTLRLRYNPTMDRWCFNLAIDDKMVLHGRRVVTGVDLLGPFDLGLGIIFAGPDKEGADPEPGRVQLINGEVKLFHILEEELILLVEQLNAYPVSS